MKTILILSVLIISGCVIYDPELQEHLEAERYFHSYDQEYISDCIFYEDLICDFE